MKIGVYGGTFDPPHLGHMEAARAAAEALGLDKLLLIPAAVPPHKALPPDAVAPQARLAMAAMVADGVNLELKSPGLAEASAAEIKEIVGLVQDYDIPAIFTEKNGSDATAQTIARETGCEVFQLDMIMSGDGQGLTPYVDALRGNVETIVNALGEGQVTVTAGGLVEE